MSQSTPSPDLSFTLHPTATPTPAEQRSALLANPGFGKVFTDHMASVRYSADRGWHDAEIIARAPIALDPAAAVLHYAQEIFEGLKAYRTADDHIVSFRADANAARFNASAARMAMTTLPDGLFLDAIDALVRTDRDWVPAADSGSLYLRPFMFADEAFLGVRPAQTYRFLVIASPAGSYFKGGNAGISVRVSQKYTRAAPGGTGAAKCGGNYAAGLLAQGEAVAAGCDQAMFLDAAEHRWIEELSGMNLFFVMADGSIVTPPLDGTILPGITRDAVITLAREAGHVVREERISIDALREGATSGAVSEAFACGTAAVIAPIKRVEIGDDAFSISNGNAPVALSLSERLVGIQRGRIADTHGWVRQIV